MRRLFLSCLSTILFLSGYAYDLRVDDVNYDLNHETHEAEVSGCSSRVSGISIREELEVNKVIYKVTAIHDSAFYGKGSLAAVDIPCSISYIGKCAFRDCGRLTNADIPASVKTIGEYAFRGCTSMQAFVVDEDNPWLTSVDGILFDKTNGVLLQAPRRVDNMVHVPQWVREVAPYAFYGSSLSAIVMYNQVERIGEHAFDNIGNLREVTIGTGIRSVGTKAFDRCKNLKDVYCQAEVPPTSPDDIFDYAWMEFITLHVPSASVKTYGKTKPWNWLLDIVPLTDREIEVGLPHPACDINEVTSYTLDGRKAVNDKGIKVIRTTDGRTRKLLKKL